MLTSGCPSDFHHVQTTACTHPVVHRMHTSSGPPDAAHPVVHRMRHIRWTTSGTFPDAWGCDIRWSTGGQLVDHRMWRSPVYWVTQVCNAYKCVRATTETRKNVVYYSRVIFGPPVTTESRGRFESGFGYFEVFEKNWAPMPLAKVWAKPRRGQNPKWLPAAILDLLKSAILRRFYPNNTIEVSFLTNSEVRNPFQGLFFQILAIFTLKSKMAAILPVIIC